MKKNKQILLGVLIGLALSIPISGVSATVTSLIGKAVEGSFPVEFNGVKTEKDAIVVDGTSYLPVRAIGELLNLEVSFIDSQIKLKLKEGLHPMIDNEGMEEARKQEADEQTRADRINELERQKSLLKNKISDAKKELQRLENTLPHLEQMLNNLPNIPESEEDKQHNKLKIEAKIQETKTQIQNLKTEIADLEAELAVLEQQTQ